MISLRKTHRFVWILLVGTLFLYFAGVKAVYAVSGPIAKGHELRYFQQNSGQLSTDVFFVTTGENYRVKFLDKRVSFSFYDTHTKNWLKFSMEFAGGDRPVGQSKLSSQVNLFRGKNKKNWISNINTFSKIRYKKIAEGVDVVFYFNQKQLEYDFVISEKGKPQDVRFKLISDFELKLDESGRMMFGQADNPFLIHAPISYQKIDGQQIKVKSRYLLAGNTVGFEVGNYHKGHPLIIDPVIDYTTYWGGSGDESAKILKLSPNNDGSYYVAGTTVSYSSYSKIGGESTIDSAFLQQPTYVHAINECSQSHFSGSSPTVSDYDAFVAKFNSNHELVFASYLGGCGNDAIKDMEVKLIDSEIGIFLTGFTLSKDFPLTSAPQQRLSPNGDSTKPASDAFVTHLGETIDGQGRAQIEIKYSSYLGGDGIEGGRAIAVDNAGTIYIGGYSHSRVWPAAGPCQSPGVTSTIQCQHSQVDEARSEEDPFNTSAADGFIAAVGKTGVVRYISYLGGSGDDWIADMLITNESGTEKLLVVGNTASADFPTIEKDSSFRPYNKGSGECSRFIPPRSTDAHSCEDIFLVKTSMDGTKILEGTFFGGSEDDTVTNVVIDEQGNPILTGVTQSTPIRVGSSGLVDVDSIENIDALLGSGQQALSGSELEQFALDRFPLVNALDDNINDSVEDNRSVDIFITKLNRELDSILFSTFIRGSNREGVSDLQYANQSIYLTGHTQSVDFPVSKGFQSIPVRGDGFIVKVITEDNKPEIAFSSLFGAEGNDFIDALDVDAQDRIYYIGGTRSRELSLVGQTIGTGLSKRLYDAKDSSGEIVSLETFTTDLFIGRVDLAQASADVDLDVQMAYPETATLGDRIEFQVAVENKGTEMATDVRLYFEMPVSGFTGKQILSSYPCTLLDYPDTTVQDLDYQQKIDKNFQFYCALGDLPAGVDSIKSLSFSVTADQQGTMRVFTGAQGQSYDKDQTNNRRSGIVSVREKVSRSSISPPSLLLLFLFLLIYVGLRRRFL